MCRKKWKTMKIRIKQGIKDYCWIAFQIWDTKTTSRNSYSRCIYCLPSNFSLPLPVSSLPSLFLVRLYINKIRDRIIHESKQVAVLDLSMLILCALCDYLLHEQDLEESANKLHSAMSLHYPEHLHDSFDLLLLRPWSNCHRISFDIWNIPGSYNFFTLCKINGVINITVPMRIKSAYWNGIHLLSPDHNLSASLYHIQREVDLHINLLSHYPSDISLHHIRYKGKYQ